MISLKASRFRVSHDGDDYHVFTNMGNGYEEVTNKLTDNDKDELIDDLVYCVQDLVKSLTEVKSTLQHVVCLDKRGDIPVASKEFLQDCKETADKYKR